METQARLERLERLLLMVLMQHAEIRAMLAALDGNYCETATPDAQLRQKLVLDHELNMIGLMVRTEGLADPLEAVRRIRFPEQAG